MTGAASLPVHGGVGAGSCEVVALNRVGARAGLLVDAQIPGGEQLVGAREATRRAAHLDNVFS